VLIQGSAVGNFEIIRSNVSRIRTIYPEVLVVLSTWADEDLTEMERIDGLVVLQSTKPANRGISNLNLQIVSTLVGLRYFQTRNIDYAAKIRTDQEFLNPLWITNLVNHYLEFCSPSSYRRIVVSSLNTLCFRKYSISDMFLFGKVEDLFAYWNVGLDPRTRLETSHATDLDFDSWSKARLAENYLSSKYLEHSGVELDYSFSQYYEILWKYFAVIDATELGQIWSKYTSLTPAITASNFPSEWSEMTCSLWKSIPLYSSKLEAIGNLVTKAR
jgi:hypothetical protein